MDAVYIFTFVGRRREFLGERLNYIVNNFHTLFLSCQLLLHRHISFHSAYLWRTSSFLSRPQGGYITSPPTSLRKGSTYSLTCINQLQTTELQLNLPPLLRNQKHYSLTDLRIHFWLRNCFIQLLLFSQSPPFIHSLIRSIRAIYSIYVLEHTSIQWDI